MGANKNPQIVGIYCYLAKDKLFFLYSQSQIIPLLVSLGELLGPKYLDGNDISVNLKMANWREIKRKQNNSPLHRNYRVW